jgi:hypothetical protein
MADTSLSETKEVIQHHGETQTRLGEKAFREGRDADARRHADRADAALNEGVLLHGNDEAGDANYGSSAAFEVGRQARACEVGSPATNQSLDLDPR